MESFNKKDREKKRRKKQQEKRERREQRKLEKAEKGGSSFEDMLYYVDENGNLSATPPDPTKKKKIKVEDIVLGGSNRDSQTFEKIRKGVVKFFNDDKGYGFIIDSKTRESVFVHANSVNGTLKERDKVQFEIEMGPKGASAINVELLGKK